MSFGDIIRSASSPSSKPWGIGGDTSTLWHCDVGTEKIYELDTSDFSVIRSASSPDTLPTSVGGNTSTLWHCDENVRLLYELDTSDFSVVRSASSPGIWPYGMGGDTSTLWHCDSNTSLVYELNTSDFSVIRSASDPGDYQRGIGGDTSTIWFCKINTDLNYELDTSDFSVVRSASSPGSYPFGIGGDTSTIWHCDYSANTIYELDTPPSVYTISGIVYDENSDLFQGVTIEAVGTTTYNTTTAIDGTYSLTVDADQYTVTASKTLYDDNIANIDARTSDQTQNFTMVLTTYTISGNVSNDLGQDLEGVPIILKNGTDYETITDSDGDYSQIVDADVYDVTASLLGDEDQTESVDASLSDETQDFVFNINTAPQDKGVRLRERYLL